MAAIRVGALEAGESGGEVAAFVEVFDGFDGKGVKRAVDLAVFGFVVGEEVVPGMVDDLPERRGAGATRSINGWRKCSFDQNTGGRASGKCVIANSSRL